MDQERERLDIVDNHETKSEIENFENIFEKYYTNYKGVVNPVVHEVKIKVKNDKIIYSKPRRMSWEERKIVKESVEDMLKEGVIRESDSEYASRIILVKKKNGKTRMCIDYRKLNEIVEKDHYPMPIIEDLIQKLHYKKYFSSLDLRNGFHHVDIEEQSKGFTQFKTPDGQYEYNKLPFGLANAPAAFVKYLKKVLKGFEQSDDIIIFMDDILIATKDIKEHEKIVIELLKILASNKVKLQMSKCKWVKTEIELLGYRVTREGITPNNTHIKSIKDYPIPLNVKAV